MSTRKDKLIRKNVMKNNFFVILSLWFIFTIEAQADNRLNGRWFFASELPALESEYVLNNGIFELSNGGILQSRGTFITSNGNITFHTTHYFGNTFNAAFDMLGIPRLELRWYTVNEIESIYREAGVPEAMIPHIQTVSYSVNANTLTLTHEEVNLFGVVMRPTFIFSRR